MKMDALTRRVLSAHAADPTAEPPELAEHLGISEDVVRHRLALLRTDGVIANTTVRINGAPVGYPYEAFILAAPSPQTTREELEHLAGAPLVTRMFTLATRRSIAFTILGTHPDDAFQRGEALAEAAHLEDVAAVMVVDTLTDNPGEALARAVLGRSGAPTPPPAPEADLVQQETP